MLVSFCSALCIFLLYSCSSSSSSSAQKAKGPVNVLIKTGMGDIEVELYDQTPQHRDNFVKLVKEGFYDGVLFHRVIKEFMIQAGDPDSKNAKAGAQLGRGGPDYTIPAEFVPELIHQRGALSAARQGDNVNPQKASSGSQFYIVQGKIFSDEELNRIEAQRTMGLTQQMFTRYIEEEKEKAKAGGKDIDQQKIQEAAKAKATEWAQNNPYKMPEERRQIYKTIGGTPHLDDEYTVFGRVTKGLEVVEAISLVATAAADRPIKDVKIIKMKIK
jgi:cyclophilin family peptidyl-prolyl cis-trans isomerase